MKATIYLACLLSALTPLMSYGQGQLTPPTSTFPYVNERALTPSGAPTRSMKTLMHIDAGEHIPSRDASNPNLNGSLGYYLLSQPGRYYLTENLDKRILITSDNVTLDLGGFEVRYTGAGTGPVAIEAQSGVAGNILRSKVMNGRVRGNWQMGVKLSDDSVVSGVDVSDATNYGIKVGKNSQVTDSRVRGLWSQGNPGAPGPHSAIYGDDATVISQCSVGDMNAIGIQVNQNGRVVDSTVQSVQGCGIVTNHHSTVAGCSVRICGSTGFDLGMGSTLHNSSCSECGDSGVHVRNGCSLVNVTSRDNQDHGFLSEAWTVMNPGYSRNATSFTDCVAQGNDGDGFRGWHNNLFTNCTADDNGAVGVVMQGNGFYVGDQSRFTNCMASGNQLSGFIGNTGNTVDSCSAVGNGRHGVEFMSIDNTVIRNTTWNNTLAPFQPAPGTGGIAPTQLPSIATNPFANFAL
jgi:hypothetical protein